jgi:hypothetical protein
MTPPTARGKIGQLEWQFQQTWTPGKEKFPQSMVKVLMLDSQSPQISTWIDSLGLFTLSVNQDDVMLPSQGRRGGQPGTYN